jgi:hypothetical protein
MLGLSPLGTFHTLISLAALGAGFSSLISEGAISIRNARGKFYVAATVVSCLTAFGIFNHGDWGPGHSLAIVTLVVTMASLMASTSALFGTTSSYVSTIGLSATVLFHLIPGVTEATTRLPLGNPLFGSPEDPLLKAITGAMLLVFLMGATLQFRVLRSRTNHCRTSP